LNGGSVVGTNKNDDEMRRSNLGSGSARVEKWPDSRLQWKHKTMFEYTGPFFFSTPFTAVMDLILNVADDLFLDRVWAKLVPLSAFPQAAANVSTSYVAPIAAASKWTSLVARLPHPPLTQLDPAILSTPQALSTVSAWPRDYFWRQISSLAVITIIGINVMYFAIAGFSYYFIFNHEMKKHPRFLKNQVRQEIRTSVGAFPGMLALILPWFQAEVMGYSKMYDGLDTYGWAYYIFSIPW